MEPDDPSSAKTPRPSRKQGPRASTTGRLPPSQVKAETEAAPISIDHLTAATAKHFRALDRERRQFLEDIKSLRNELTQACGDLDRIRPELATALERLRNIEWLTIVASAYGFRATRGRKV